VQKCRLRRCTGCIDKTVLLYITWFVVALAVHIDSERERVERERLEACIMAGALPYEYSG
jgi:hypothetical protein